MNGKFIDNVVDFGVIRRYNYGIDYIAVSDIVKFYKLNRSLVFRAVRSNIIDGFMVRYGHVTIIRYYVYLNDKFSSWLDSVSET